MTRFGQQELSLTEDVSQVCCEWRVCCESSQALIPDIVLSIEQMCVNLEVGIVYTDGC